MAKSKKQIYNEFLIDEKRFSDEIAEIEQKSRELEDARSAAQKRLRTATASKLKFIRRSFNTFKRSDICAALDLVEYTCPVCQETKMQTNESTSFFGCPHDVCNTCISGMYRVSRGEMSCPICRRMIASQAHQPVEFEEDAEVAVVMQQEINEIVDSDDDDEPTQDPDFIPPEEPVTPPQPTRDEPVWLRRRAGD